MGQVITFVQEKGGAGKTTLLAALSSYMKKDGAKCAIVDTDSTKAISAWLDIDDQGMDHTYVEDDSQITPIIRELQQNYDVVFVDTAGYKSSMSIYAMYSSDLIIIPSKASMPDAKSAIKTWKNVKVLSDTINKELPFCCILVDVDPQEKMTGAIKKAFSDAGVPPLDAFAKSTTEFKKMISIGGGPKGLALKSTKEIIASLQMNKMLDYYEKKIWLS